MRIYWKMIALKVSVLPNLLSNHRKYFEAALYFFWRADTETITILHANGSIIAMDLNIVFHPIFDLSHTAHLLGIWTPSR